MAGAKCQRPLCALKSPFLLLVVQLFVTMLADKIVGLTAGTNGYNSFYLWNGVRDLSF